MWNVWRLLGRCSVWDVWLLARMAWRLSRRNGGSPVWRWNVWLLARMAWRLSRRNECGVTTFSFYICIGFLISVELSQYFSFYSNLFVHCILISVLYCQNHIFMSSIKFIYYIPEIFLRICLLLIQLCKFMYSVLCNFSHLIFIHLTGFVQHFLKWAMSRNYLSCKCSFIIYALQINRALPVPAT